MTCHRDCQQLAGHASPLTTARYDRRGETAKQAAINKVYVPYHPRKVPAALMSITK